MISLFLGVFLAACAPQAIVPNPTPTQATTFPQAQIAALPTATILQNTASPTLPRPTATAAQASIGRKASATPTSPALAATLPARAEVKGMYGYGQLLPLSCESRSAADWARHFGIEIHELEFFSRLPKTRDPEVGFVGNPLGGWGLIPPDAYGVHAGPVASVLQAYGAQASAVRRMPLERLRAEIAAGRPVIVWVTGHVAAGKGTNDLVDGKVILVARYEHTVIVTGYDEQNINILDGKIIYQRPTGLFLQSWAALENMAIVWDEALMIRKPTVISK